MKEKNSVKKKIRIRDEVLLSKIGQPLIPPKFFTLQDAYRKN
jgi:hypothetical protein